MSRVVYWALAAAGVAVVVFVLTHLGAYPWILDTWWFAALAWLVLINTVVYASLAAVKMGWQLGRKQRSGDGRR